MRDDLAAAADALPDTDEARQAVRRDVQDEPVNTDGRGVPDAADPQAGLLVDDDSHEPDSARGLHPRVGDKVGP